MYIIKIFLLYKKLSGLPITMVWFLCMRITSFTNQKRYRTRIFIKLHTLGQIFYSTEFQTGCIKVNRFNFDLKCRYRILRLTLSRDVKKAESYIVKRLWLKIQKPIAQSCIIKRRKSKPYSFRFLLAVFTVVIIEMCTTLKSTDKKEHWVYYKCYIFL